MTLPINPSIVMKAPAPFAKPERTVGWQGLTITSQQRTSVEGYLKTQGLDPAKGSKRGDVVYFGGDNGFGVFADGNKNLVVTGGKANSPGGVNGAGFSINSAGKTVERTDLPPQGPGARPGAPMAPGGNGGGFGGGFGGPPGAPPPVKPPA